MNFKKIFSLSCLGLVCLTSSVAFSAEWVQVNTHIRSLDIDQYFYDKSKLILRANTREIIYWKRVQFKKPVYVRPRFANVALMRERLNCQEHTIKLLSSTYYDTVGNIITSITPPNGDGPGDAVVPDSVGDAYEQALCRLLPPAPATDQPTTAKDVPASVPIRPSTPTLEHTTPRQVIDLPKVEGKNTVAPPPPPVVTPSVNKNPQIGQILKLGR